MEYTSLLPIKEHNLRPLECLVPSPQEKMQQSHRDVTYSTGHIDTNITTLYGVHNAGKGGIIMLYLWGKKSIVIKVQEGKAGLWFSLLV